MLAGADGKDIDRPCTNESQIASNNLFGGDHGELKPGQAADIPAVIDPLPPGRYTLKRVRRDETVYYLGGDNGRATLDWPALAADVNRPLVVKDDPALAAALGQEVLKKFRADDPTAQFLVYRYRVPAVMDALNKDLESNDLEVVMPAINFMCGWPDHPPAVGRAIARQTRVILAKELSSEDFARELMNSAQQDGTDPSLDAVMAVLAHPYFARQAERWVGYLDGFKQPAAVEVAHRYLTDPRLAVRYEAATHLARRQDPAAVPVLLAILKDLEEKHNAKELTAVTGVDPLQQVLYGLSEFPKDPRVIEAVRAAAKSPDEAMRKAAATPMERLKYWETH